MRIYARAVVGLAATALLSLLLILQACGPESEDSTPGTATAEPVPIDAGFSEVRTLAQAGLEGPSAIAVAPDGTIVIADFEMRAVLRLGPDGTLTVIAGGNGEGLTDGPGSVAQFAGPAAVVVAEDGIIYVSDAPNHRVRAISPDGAVTSVAGSGGVGLTNGGFADGPALSAQLNLPSGLAFDRDGSLLIADKDNHAIRRLTSDGLVTTVLGGAEGFVDGPLDEARLSFPVGVAVAADGTVFITEHGNNAVRRMTADRLDTVVSARPPALGKPGPIEGLAFPSGIAVDSAGKVYVADVQNHRILRIMGDSEVVTVAGSRSAGFADGPPAMATFHGPTGVSVTGSGSVVVADEGNSAIRELLR